MERPAAVALLDTWEAARTRRPLERSLALLALVEGELDAAAWPLGKRDSRLLTLRELLFGGQLSGLASCPQCSSRLEVALDIAALRAPFAENEPSELRFETAGAAFCVRVRPILLHDLMTLHEAAQADSLLERCLLEVRCNEEPYPAADLPGEARAAISAHLAALDPQADLQLALRCAPCGHHWLAPFDIGAYLWREIDAWAQRLLHEVHTLALAYGWSEAAILALSPGRRQAYLDMVTA